ncbi:MAG: NAD(P)-binding domain-containing protein [Planctomycetota bacterium]
MKVGVLGSGDVARTLAAGLTAHGHEVMLGTRDAAKLAEWQAQNAAVTVGTVEATAAFAELVILAVKGTVALAVVRQVGEAIAGKPVIDACNPIADAAPDHGVLHFFTGPGESLMEMLQKACPAAHFVKAFNSVGHALMIDPELEGGPPTMFVCGDDATAKATVSRLLGEVGWDAADMGGVQAARAIEPLCMLWCIPGFLRNDWVHAFKLLRAKA